ncbi:MAG TPA: hypothetical protein PK530_25430 [Anaerolineales bacterium]|nr:hypothetical protein [Anaerolineales bacterium]
MELTEQFSLIFDVAFKKPKLKTTRVRHLWVDLILVNEWLSGPLYNLLTTGDFDYIFTNQDGQFPGVKTVDDFRVWAVNLAEEYKQGVMDFSPSNSDEVEDQAKLLEIAQAMHQAAELAYQIQKSRFQA